MNQKILSIVITTYNSEKTVERLLNSFDVTDNDVELLIVDDCSTDNTIQKIPDNIKVYRLKEHNGNPGLLRNAGTDLATGTWIWHLDSDDYLCKKNLTDLIETLKKSKADILHISHMYVERDGKKHKVSQHYQKTDTPILDNLVKRLILPGTYSFICKKAVFKAFPQSEGILEDYEFMIRLVNSQFVFQSYDDVLYVYCPTPTGMHNYNKSIKNSTKDILKLLKTIQAEVKNPLEREPLLLNVCRGTVGVEIAPHFFNNYEQSLKQCDELPYSPDVNLLLKILYNTLFNVTKEELQQMLAQRDRPPLGELGEEDS